jgi:proteasome lid subunit RPN8/RPN11
VIRLPDSIVEQMNRHGEATYPHEACGLLLGVLDDDGAKRVDEALALDNAREDEARHHRYVIRPEDLVRADREARARGRDIVGVYHSHPDHPDEPSRYDLENAWPVYSYVILSVRGGRAASLRSWELVADRSRFDPEPLVKGS